MVADAYRMVFKMISRRVRGLSRAMLKKGHLHLKFAPSSTERHAGRRRRLTRFDAPRWPSKSFPNPHIAFRDMGAFSVRGARLGLHGFPAMVESDASHALLPDAGYRAGISDRLRSSCARASPGADCF